MDVPDCFLGSTILKASVNYTVGDHFTSVFAGLDEVAIREYTVITTLVIYLNTERLCIAIDTLFSIERRLRRSVFYVLDILQIQMAININGGVSIVLLHGDSLQLHDETNLMRIELVD